MEDGNGKWLLRAPIQVIVEAPGGAAQFDVNEVHTVTEDPRWLRLVRDGGLQTMVRRESVIFVHEQSSLQGAVVRQ